MRTNHDKLQIIADLSISRQIVGCLELKLMDESTR
jgi:hypothetical protein